jgi:hypothetical protein
MSCKVCTSVRQAEFGAEINIHFSGREGLEKPAVWIFSKLLVCLQCGTTEFAIPEAELALLGGDTGRKGATRTTENTDDVSPQ